MKTLTNPYANIVAPKAKRLAKARRWLVQALIVSLVLALIVWFAAAIRSALARKGIAFSFDYLFQPAGVSLSEGTTLVFHDGWPTLAGFQPSDSNLQALAAGLTNTLRVALAAIVASTVLGTLFGLGRLSTNWPVRNLSFGLVEFVRNTPLLIQLVFWYFAVVLKLPPARAAGSIFGSFIVSQAGVFLPWVRGAHAASPASCACLVSAGLACGLAWVPKLRKGRSALAAVAAGAFAASVGLGFPLAFDVPLKTRFGASGGLTLSPEMTALLVAITINSAAYVAEIVRGAIDALPRGQWEAASALGLSRGATLRDVILPQVLRIVLPSLGNRYISLTKDTSLGIAIGFPDLFNVSGTIANQTGRNLEGVILVMLAYLILSWAISAAVNLVNQHVNQSRASR